MYSFRYLTAHSIFLALFLAAPAYAADEPQEKIQHIIVISLENHSFDNLFGTFPGAEGISEAQKTALQTDNYGAAYQTLPPVFDTRTHPASIDKHFPSDLPNQPFPIDKYVPITEKTGDLVHRFTEEQDQIHGGKMDRFAAISDAGGLTMGYYNGSKLGLWKYAQDYTLADHFFHAAFGGSFLNHFWLICACTPRFHGAPKALKADGRVTPDGYAVNTVFSVQTPHPPHIKDTSQLLPPQDFITIGDRLSSKKVSWTWYSGGWKEAIAKRPSPSYQFHHQPFTYFRAYNENSLLRAVHLKDETDLFDDLKKDTLPAVAFYKPLGEFDMHPSYADVGAGDAHIVEILHAIEQSNAWKSSVIIVTFDENGGYWDHMPPPPGDRWGPGGRVPTIIISPFAKKHFVDHTVYDTTSILKLIESRFKLEPLGTRDALANNMLNALELQ